MRESFRARERERDFERERSLRRVTWQWVRERVRDRIQKSGKNCTPNNFPVFWHRPHLSSVFHGKSPAPKVADVVLRRLMLVMGESRDRRPTVRDGESTFLDHIITMRWELGLHTCLPEKSRVNGHRGISSLGFSREPSADCQYGERYFPQRVSSDLGKFSRQKSAEFGLRLIPSWSIWSSRFPGSDRFLSGGHTWPCFRRFKKNNNNREDFEI